MKDDGLNPGGTPKHDKYDMDPDKKAFGYPAGQCTLFVAGRFLRGIEHNAVRGMLTTGAGATNDTGALAVRTTPRGRGLYIPWVVGGTDWYFQDNVTVSWQLWAMNQMIASAVCGQFRADIGIFIPPETQVTFYLRCQNTLATAVYHRYTVPWYEFNADDVWEMGSGGNAGNPAVGTLTWP